jgi:hypothetical protein
MTPRRSSIPREDPMAEKTVKMNLKRAYTYHGKDYGPGPVDVPEVIKVGNDELRPAEDLAAKEKQYEEHLSAGGEAVAPVTPSVAGNVSGEPENKSALPKPSSTAQATGPTGAAANASKGAAVTPVDTSAKR